MNKFRIKALKAVYKKEIIDVLRDKRTLVIMILLPLILYPLIMLASSQLGILIMRSQEEKVFDVAFDFPPDNRLEKLIEERYEDYKINIKYIEDAAKAFEDGEVKLYVTREIKNSKELYKIYYNSSDTDASTALNRVRNLFKDYKTMITTNYIEDAGLDADFIMEPIAYEAVDVVEEEEITGMIFGTILPFILIVGVVTGAMYPAIDVTSGEKERGTLETLLTLPVSNMELMGGKFLAVSTVAVASAILNFISMVLVGLFMIISIASQAAGGEKAINISLAPLIIPFIITLVCLVVFALFVSAIILCVTSFAKSFKEANNYMTPVLLIFMLPAFVSIVPGVNLTPRTAAIPVANIALLIREVMALNYDVTNMAIVLMSNVIYAVIGVVALSKIYNSESVLFGSGTEFNLLERRSHIIKGSKVTLGDGLILYSVGLLLLIYLSSFFTLKLGFYGIAATQLFILALPLIAAFYLKADFKKTFKLKLPCIKDIIGTLILWIGTFILANLVGNILLYLFPENEEVVTQLNIILKGDNLWITLLVVALLPAICEELFFRGFIYSSLEGSVKVRNAVIINGLMFALYHIDFVRIIPTFILGAAFAFAVSKSGSIFLSIAMHFVNNAVGVLALFYPEVFESLDQAIMAVEDGWIRMAILLLLAALLIAAGYRIISSSSGDKR